MNNQTFKYENDIGIICWFESYKNQILIGFNDNVDNIQVYPKLERILKPKKHYDNDYKLYYMLTLDDFLAIFKMLEHHINTNPTLDEILDFLGQTKINGISINRSKYHDFYNNIDLASFYLDASSVSRVNISAFLNEFLKYTQENPERNIFNSISMRYKSFISIKENNNIIYEDKSSNQIVSTIVNDVGIDDILDSLF